MRSYGIYLWHWPVFMVTRPHADIPLSGTLLLVIRIATTFLLATLSYKYVEEPIRHGAIGRRLHALRGATGERRSQLARRLVALCAAVALGGFVVAAGLALAEPASRPSGAPRQARLVLMPTPTARPATAPSLLGNDSTGDSATSGASSTTTTIGATATPPITTSVTARVTAVGDSVMLGAAETLADVVGRDRTLVDAAESRQFSTGVDLLQTYRDSGELGDVVVVQLGTNGPVPPEEFDRMMRALDAVPKVLVVNLKVPRWWEADVNELLAVGVKRYKNAVLVDWHALAQDRPELFWDDGYHLNPQGREFYAQVIVRHL